MEPESEPMNPAKEPYWPLIVGSLVPIAALFMSGGHGGGLGEAAVGAVIVVTLGLYLLLTFPIETMVLSAFSKRGFYRCLKVSYSMQAWKLSSFLICSAIFYTCGQWCYGLFRWLGPVGSFLRWASNWTSSILILGISFLMGIAILELGHRLKLSKGLVVALIATEFGVFAAIHGFWHLWLLRSHVI